MVPLHSTQLDRTLGLGSLGPRLSPCLLDGREEEGSSQEESTVNPEKLHEEV